MAFEPPAGKSIPAPPPRHGARNSSAVIPGQSTKALTGQLRDREETLNGYVQIASFGLTLANQHADAGAVSLHGPGIAHQVAILSKDNEGIAKALDAGNQLGKYGDLIVLCMPLVVQLLVNHRRINASSVPLDGIVAPEVLEAQVKASQARMAAEALQMQQEAERELARVQALTEASRQSQASMGAANGHVEGATIQP